MLCIFSPYTDCYSNIASEEYLLSSTFSDPVFFLYKNTPSIIVGCNQNTFSEINQDYIKKNNIKVVRRRSGGGAVYHDLGNLNFGFIFEKNDNEIDEIFKEFTRPILEVLQDLGVNAVFSGRNDLTIDGNKFSGNAQYHTSKKVLVHGTLLFDSDLSVVAQSLSASPLKFQDKGVKSIKSRVTNIRPHLTMDLTMDQFAEKVLNKIHSLFFDFQLYTYTAQDVAAIKELVEKKYATWDWTFGNSPQFTYAHAFRYTAGTVEICLNVAAGIIENTKIYGDFFGDFSDLSTLENTLKGLPFRYGSIESALKNIDISNYMAKLSNEEFCKEIFSHNIED